ncbi:MAG: glycosyltransferase family 2 protein, partial [Bosea sp. (in: a-proteobacteria)]
MSEVTNARRMVSELICKALWVKPVLPTRLLARPPSPRRHRLLSAPWHRTGMVDALDLLPDLFQREPEGFETVAVSPGLEPTSIAAVVCVPTYKRPELLAATLRSLAAQQGAPTFAVIVVENEGNAREGASVAGAMLDGAALQGLVLVEPRQGNCNAYNAAWRCVLTRFPNAKFICGIDDDE